MAWAFPISVIGALVLVLGWLRLLVFFVAMVWGIAAAQFTFFPWLSGRMRHASQESPRWTRFLVFFDPGIRRNLVVWLAVVAGLCAHAYIFGGSIPWRLIGWSLAALFIVLLISIDLAGSTPLYKSSLHEDRLLRIELDNETCQGRAMCWEVCPKNCYVIDAHRHKAVIALRDACVQCGACVVQCPEDALAFVAPSGERIAPETIRKYKLNLLGQRALEVPSRTEG